MNNIINREEADVRLKKLSLDEYEHKFVKALGGLLLELQIDSIYATSLLRFKEENKPGIWRNEAYCSGEKDHFDLCKDLLDICISCKDVLGHQLIKEVLEIQIIGLTVHSYLLKLPDKGLYCMTEITMAKILDSLENPLSLVLQFPNLVMYFIESVYSTRILRV
ncbi:hypothetical protein EDC96DRAFT_546158 [Choanephora cucurbitarum]|nr:hypothetical protein EDC96DRAFT_546158 [Choanephora cucurbitarum]